MLDFSSSLTLIFKLTFHFHKFFLLLRSPKIVIEHKGRICSAFVHTKAIQSKIKAITSSAQSSPRASAFPFKQLWFASIFSLGKLQLQCYSWRILYIFRGYSWFLWGNYVMISSSRLRTSISRVMIAMNHKPPRPDHVNLNVSDVQIYLFTGPVQIVYPYPVTDWLIALFLQISSICDHWICDVKEVTCLEERLH